MKIPQIERILRAIMLDDLSLPNLVKLIEKEIADIYPYDHAQKDIPKACNVSMPDTFSIKLKPSGEGGLIVSKIVEQVEQNLSKRQIALGYVGAILAMKKAGIDPSMFERDSDDDGEESSESSMGLDALRRLETGDLPDAKDLSMAEIMQIMSILEKAKRRK